VVIVDLDRMAQALGSPDHHERLPPIRAVAVVARQAAVETVVRLNRVRVWIIDTALSHAATVSMRRR
jgi:hypothetical protein